jgi:hypothetical protein
MIHWRRTVENGRLLAVGLVAVSCLACGGGPTSPTSGSSSPSSTQPVRTITLESTAISNVLHVGETQKYTAHLVVTGGTAPVDRVLLTWSSSNSNVLSVTRDGKAIALNVGEAILQVSDADSTVSVSVQVVP